MSNTGLCIGGPYAGRRFTAAAPFIALSAADETSPAAGGGPIVTYAWAPFVADARPTGFWVPLDVPEAERGAYVLDHLTRAYAAQTGA